MEKAVAVKLAETEEWSVPLPRTTHRTYQGDVRAMPQVADSSVHFVVTSPHTSISKRIIRATAPSSATSRSTPTFATNWRPRLTGMLPSTLEQRTASLIEEDLFDRWFQQIWSDVAGASLKDHPAPFPFEIADRLIRMVSFVGDTVLDPCPRTGTTTAAAIAASRHSLGIEVEANHRELIRRNLAQRRLDQEDDVIVLDDRQPHLPGGSRSTTIEHTGRWWLPAVRSAMGGDALERQVRPGRANV